jgi:hypothetical protein
MGAAERQLLFRVDAFTIWVFDSSHAGARGLRFGLEDLSLHLRLTLRRLAPSLAFWLSLDLGVEPVDLVLELSFRSA